MCNTSPLGEIMSILKIPESIYKGDSKLIELKDDKTSIGYIYIDYKNNDSVQIHQKFQGEDRWKCKCIINTKIKELEK